MDPRLSPFPDYKNERYEVAGPYRVTIWEQPSSPDIDPADMAWHETTYDLGGPHDVRDVIRWAENTLALDKGPLSSEGVPVHDREYVIYARVLHGDRWLQLAGWDPTRGSESQRNLARLTRPA